MGLPLTQGTYNLLEEKWIPVLYGDGKTVRVGICQALIDAGKIRQIAASNPMDRVALLRFLLAVLMWCKEGAKSSLAALDEKSAGVPEDWLAKLKEHKTAFDLLGDGPRFYQDASAKNDETRPIADLLVEFPGADSVNHMRHVVHDGSYGFCPACCAMGILRLSVWAPANGSYPASVNPGSAAYAIVEGKNLLQTLRENLPETNTPTEQAPWVCEKQPDSSGAVARLAWRPRKFWLNVGSRDGACANCGIFGELVTSLCNKGGWPTPTTDGQNFSKAVEVEFKKLGYSAKGKDQANKNAKMAVKMALLIEKCRMAELREQASGQSNPPQTPGTAEEIARLFHQLISKNDDSSKKAIKGLTKKPDEKEQRALGDGATQAKKFWDADPHLLRDAEAISLPRLEKNVAEHSSKFWRDALRLRPEQVGNVSAIGPVVNKFTFQDATSVGLPDASVAAKDLAKISADCSGKLGGLLKRVTRNPDRQHPEIGAAVSLLTPNAEARIRDRLSRLNASTDKNANDDKEFLRQVYAPVVEQVIASVTPGSPFRRRAVQNHAQALLNKKIKELVEKPDHPSDPGTHAAVPGRPKRGRKKGSSK